MFRGDWFQGPGASYSLLHIPLVCCTFSHGQRWFITTLSGLYPVGRKEEKVKSGHFLSRVWLRNFINFIGWNLPHSHTQLLRVWSRNFLASLSSGNSEDSSTKGKKMKIMLTDSGCLVYLFHSLKKINPLVLIALDLGFIVPNPKSRNKRKMTWATSSFSCISLTRDDWSFC